MDVENTIVTEGQAEDVVIRPRKRVCKKRICDMAIEPDVVALVAKLDNFEDVTEDYKNDLQKSLTKMTIPLIKAVCRHLKLRVTGKKSELVERVMHRYNTFIAGSLLQHKCKRAIVARWLELHGPALWDKKSPVNDMDLMGDDIEIYLWIHCSVFKSQVSYMHLTSLHSVL